MSFVNSLSPEMINKFKQLEEAQACQSRALMPVNTSFQGLLRPSYVNRKKVLNKDLSKKVSNYSVQSNRLSTAASHINASKKINDFRAISDFLEHHMPKTQVHSPINKRKLVKTSQPTSPVLKFKRAHIVKTKFRF